MQYYTKQQLQGAGRYTGKCRVGNWNEDTLMDEVVLKEYIAKKEAGLLKLDKFQRRMLTALQGVELTKVRDDGMYHFGDVLMIRSALNGHVLSNDVEDRDIRSGEDAFAVTATPPESAASQPCARNTYVLVKYKPNVLTVADKEYDDDVVRYGQKFYVVANPAVEDKAIDSAGGEDPLMLRSVPVSTTHFAKFSRHQEVALTHVKKFDTVWTAVSLLPKDRMAMDGQPIPVGAPVIFQHCATKQNLCVEPLECYQNDFGNELEVSAHTSTSLRTSAMMENMSKGASKADLDRIEHEANHWVMLQGDTVASLPAPPKDEFNVKKILTKIMTQLNKKGANGVKGLRAIFADKDVDGSGQLNLEEFTLALKYCLIDLSEDETKTILSAFDADKSGSISPDEFVDALSGVPAP